MTDEPTADGRRDDGDEQPAESDATGRLEDLFGVNRGRVALWVVAIAFTGVFTYLLWRYVGTVIVGLFAYYVTRPVFSRIVHPRVESRTFAVAISLVTVALPVLVLVAWTVLVAVRSLADVLDSDVGGQLAALVQPYADLNELVAELTTIVRAALDDPMTLVSADLGANLTQVLDVLLGTLGQVFNVLLHAFIVLIITFYLLRDDHRVAGWARRTFVEPDGVLDAYFRAIDRDLKNVFFGNILNALLTGFLAVVTFLLLNFVAPSGASIPEPVLLGLLVGVASLVPVIGIKLLTIPITVYLLARAGLTGPEGLWFPVVFLAVSFVVVDYIPDQLLRPYVSGRSLHVGAVMLAYTIGPILFGWYGIFLGPLVLVVLFEFARIVLPWLLHPDADVVDSPTPDTDAGEDADVAATVPESTNPDAVDPLPGVSTDDDAVDQS
jgi:predicted PurR-regulated permease PerM